MEVASGATLALMREICGQSSGTIYVSQTHVAEAIKTRKSQTLIGMDSRADRIRGWIAQSLDNGTAVMLAQSGQSWMNTQERTLALLRLQILQTGDSAEKSTLLAQLNREETKGAILTWATENEEPPRNGEPLVLRKEKRAQLRTARNRIWKAAGAGSMDAAILLLVLDGTAYPEVDPSPEWIRTSVAWILGAGWAHGNEIEMREDATARLETLRGAAAARDGDRHLDTILDMGEGWGSIGTAASQIGIATVGVDIAGVLYQGTLHGHIRARVEMDFSMPREQNLLRRISKKAGISISNLLAVWLSPECTLLSRANNMNTSRGCAHGLYAESPENIAAATPERIELERSKYQACLRSIEEQMRALEEEGVPFILENPHGSQFWELTSVKERIQRLAGTGWKIHQVDQCAYGRKSQKSTLILTNIPWTPSGLTGTGRCAIGQCGGTLGNTPGALGSGRHAQQTSANDKTRRTKVGTAAKGAKGLYSVQAAKNRVETGLVQELLEAARGFQSSGSASRAKKQKQWTKTRAP
jgi:hypothetical protein